MRSSSLLAVLLVLCAPGCTREHDVDVSIALGALREDARGLELHVFHGDCPSTEALLGSTLASEHSQMWRIDTQPRSIGRLDEGAWSFAAIARDALCAPVGAGCVTIEVGADDGATIPVNRVEMPGLGCGAGVSCDDGLCVGRPPPPPECTSDCAATGGMCCGDTCVDVRSDDSHCGDCDRACPSGQTCTSGRCLDDTECTDTTSDPANCGACGHLCPTDLICSGSLCRPREPVRQISLELEGSVAPCALMAGVLWFLSSAEGMGPDPVVGASSRYGDGASSISIDESMSGPPDVRCDPGTACIAGAAFAQVVILGDRDEDGAIDVATEYFSPAAYGVADALFVWSERDHLAGDDELERLRPSGIEFPEGILAGLFAYRNEGDPAGGELQRWVPDGRSDPAYPITLCRGESCTETVTADCIASQPNPLDQHP